MQHLAMMTFSTIVILSLTYLQIILENAYVHLHRQQLTKDVQFIQIL